MNFNDTDTRWDTIRERFRQACVLRREGRSADAANVMESEIAPLLAEWTQDAGLEPKEKRHRVESMLAEEMRRVEDACFFESRLGDQLQERFKKLVDEFSTKTVQNLRDNPEFSVDPRDRRLVKDLASQWQKRTDQLVNDLREEIRQAAERPLSDFERITAPIQQQLHSIRELHDQNSQALQDRNAKEMRETLGELLDRDMLLAPLREQIHTFLGEIREEWRLVREAQEPTLQNLLTPLRVEMRELVEELGEESRRQRQTQRQEFEEVIQKLRSEIADYAELPVKAIRKQSETLRRDVDAIMGNPRREMRKLLEPLREDLSILREESRGKALHEEWAQLRKLVESTLEDRREDVRDLLTPLSERMEEIAEMPQGEVRALRESVAEILDTLRHYPATDFREQLTQVTDELHGLANVPVGEFRKLSEELRGNLAAVRENSTEKLYEEIGALRADMETLWLNPSEDAEMVVKPLQDSLREFKKMYGPDAVEKIVQPLAENVELVRKRLSDLCKLVHYGSDDWKEKEDKQLQDKRAEIAHANKAAAQPKSVRDTRRELLRALIGEPVQKENTPRVPVWDVPSVIDSILREQKGDR